MRLLLLFLFTLSVVAADPQQPAIGGKELIQATTGYAGILNVRTQLNVGFPNEAGLIQILSTNGIYTLELFVDENGLFTLTNNAAQAFKLTPDGDGSFVGSVGAVELILTDGTTNAFVDLAPNIADGGLPFLF